MNMSYCMFENTQNDLRDCVNVMEEACSLKDLDLSESEKISYDIMADLCRRFLEQHTYLK